MKHIISKLRILANALTGYLIKYKIDIFGIGKIEPLQRRDKDNFIVSLTSYGRRINSVVYYTLVSLLKQTERPSKIILWLDYSWHDDKIPRKIKNLSKYGVEIKYCKDIKSYKKLIPALSMFPKDIIITVDDDMIYNKDLLKSLMDGYRNNGKIQCTIAGLPKIIDDDVSSYNSWESVSEACESKHLVPIGVGGVLYPPGALHKEVLNEEAFSELAPNADDLWFWTMAKMQGSSHACVELRKQNYTFDALYQYFHKGSALTHYNAGEGKNDIQLKKILNYYHINL